MACQYDFQGRPQCQILSDPRTPNDFFCAHCNTRFQKEILNSEIVPLLLLLALGLILFLTLRSENFDTRPMNQYQANPILCSPKQP